MLLIRLLVTFFTHPVTFLKKITPKRLLRFFTILFSEGTTIVSQNVKLSILDKKILHYKLNYSIYKINAALSKNNDYEHIVFKYPEKPLVSIIIPVFNQFDYTYNCLKAIYQNSGDSVSYEVIIADDCSTDLTMNIEKYFSNIRVINAQENIGFLKNCNNASKFAKGEILHFLNNDTQVQKNWLLPLLELLRSDDKIGIVGSKLLFENGLLQEAGGILWDDASAWNFGSKNDPVFPEFNYVKEVDYVSGASLMVKKSIWENIGGFDESLAPAYCEDSDICISIRNLGFKVMYQPASVVIHFEGVTNGNDISGIKKQYQINNQKKIYQKWKNVLANENFPNGEHIFHARDKSKNKKTVLIIDQYVPKFDKDRSSKIVLQLLKILASSGLNIKFIDDTFQRNEPYTSFLEQMGIEVLYGYYYFHNWKTWLYTYGSYLDIVLFFKQNIYDFYINDIKKCSKADVFYFGKSNFKKVVQSPITKEIKKLNYIKTWNNLHVLNSKTG